MPHVKSPTLFVLALALASGHACAGEAARQGTQAQQTIMRANANTPFKGSADTFTGNVEVKLLFPAGAPASFSGGSVTFQPGARSAWHTHPAGQYLIVTSGTGWTQQWGGPVMEIRAGDVVWCPPGVKHWHGASPIAAMTHIALTGTVNGKNVDWQEQVSAEQYHR